VREFWINLYKGGGFLRTLKVHAVNRHHAEEMARQEIRTTDAQSMGAVDEINR
jgi:hypothetical protein